MRRTPLLAVLLLAAGCTRSPAPPAPAPIPPVDVVRVVSQRLAATEALPADLKPWQAVAIYPKVRGFVDRIPVDRGSVVKRGDLLVLLSAPELAAQAAQAEATALGDRSTYERLLNASKVKGAVSENEIEVARQTAAADAQRVRSFKTLAGYLVISAPFDGVVTERNVHPGALVGPPAEPLTTAVPMLRVEDIARLRLTVPVPEADAHAVAEGAEVRFRVRAWPGREFRGVIRRISHWVDEGSRTMAVEADVDNRDQTLDPGMFVEVVWPVRRDVATLFVPATAIAESSEKVFVDRVRDDRIEQVKVERGRSMGDLIEVFGALGAGDLVLVHGSEDLRDGARVKPHPAHF